MRQISLVCMTTGALTLRGINYEGTTSLIPVEAVSIDMLFPTSLYLFFNGALYHIDPDLTQTLLNSMSAIGGGTCVLQTLPNQVSGVTFNYLSVPN